MATLNVIIIEFLVKVGGKSNFLKLTPTPSSSQIAHDSRTGIHVSRSSLRTRRGHVNPEWIFLNIPLPYSTRAIISKKNKWLFKACVLLQRLTHTQLKTWLLLEWSSSGCTKPGVNVDVHFLSCLTHTIQVRVGTNWGLKNGKTSQETGLATDPLWELGRMISFKSSHGPSAGFDL